MLNTQHCFKTLHQVDLLTVGFEFRDTFYYSLIRVKEKAAGTDYEITVMNGNLEKLFYGNHVIHQRNDCLQVGIKDSSEQELLKLSIAEALSKFLYLPLEKNTTNKTPFKVKVLQPMASYDM